MIKQLLEILQCDPPQFSIIANANNEKASTIRKKTLSSSSSNSVPSTRPQHETITSNVVNHFHHQQPSHHNPNHFELNRQRLLKDYEDNDDEDIIVVDGEFDLEKAESHSENENENYDDDDDVEYGQNRVSSAQTVTTLVSGELQASEIDLDENSLEISILEKFKYTIEYKRNKKDLVYFKIYSSLPKKGCLPKRNQF